MVKINSVASSTLPFANNSCTTIPDTLGMRVKQFLCPNRTSCMSARRHFRALIACLEQAKSNGSAAKLGIASNYPDTPARKFS